MSLKAELRSISHRYHLEIHQTYKIMKETCDKLHISQNKPVEILKEKRYEKATNTLLKKLKEKKGKEIKFTEDESFVLSVLDKSFLSSIHVNAFLNMALIYFITLFEAFNKDFFIELYKNKKEILKSKKEIKFEEILEHTSVKKIILHMAEKEMDSTSYMNIDEFADYLIKKVDVDITTYDKWDRLRENYYRRNVFVHARGLVNKKYLNKIECDFKVGLKLQNDIEYIEKCHDNVHEYISFVEKKVVAKFRS